MNGEGYKPSEEEVEKGEKMMDYDQSKDSKERSRSVERYSEALRKAIDRFENQASKASEDFHVDMNDALGLWGAGGHKEYEDKTIQRNLPPELAGDVKKIQEIQSEIYKKRQELKGLFKSASVE